MIKVPLTIFEGGLLLKFIRIFHSGSAMWIYRQSFPLHPNARRFCRFQFGKDRSNLYEHHQKSLHLLQDRNFRLQVPDKFDHKSSECPVCQELQALLRVRKAHHQFYRCCQSGKYRMLPAHQHLPNYKQSVRKLCRHLQMHEYC